VTEALDRGAVSRYTQRAEFESHFLMPGSEG
jgi:hypothetical protein